MTPAPSSRHIRLPRVTSHQCAGAVVALLAVGLTGCTSAGTPAQTSLPGLPTSVTTTATSGTTGSTTPTAGPADYRDLLLSAADLSDPEDTFTERSRESQPDASPGARAFFVNGDDNRAITDTFLVYPDAATATATLRQAAGTLATLVAGSTPKPVAVGTDGVTITGTYPDDAKAVTLLFFTEGRALVRLEFQSAAGDPTTATFVTNVGKMQQIALRIGLAGGR